MKSKFWIKLWHELIDDAKMAMLSDRLWRRLIESFLLAGDNDKDGYLPSLDTMAWRLHMSSEELETDLVELQNRAFLNMNMGSWYVVNFSTRQARLPDSIRQKAYRERKIQQKFNFDEIVDDKIEEEK